MQQPPQGQGPFQPADYAFTNGQPAQSQWTQMGVPGQGGPGPGYQAPVQGQGPRMPGQLPPPAQIDLPPQMMPVQPMPGYDVQGMGYGQMPMQPNPGETQPVYETASAQHSGYQAPKTGLPRAKQQKKNLGIYIALTVIVLGFAVFAVLRMLSPGQAAYGYVRNGSLSARYTGDAVVVRSETVYQHSGASQIDYQAEEGTFVERGDKVATAYTSGFSAKELTTLNNYRNQIKNYHKNLIENAAGDTRLISLMDQVSGRAMEAQKLVQGTQGSLSQQESLLANSMNELRLYIKQKYPDDQKLSRLYDDEEAQLNRISTWSKQYAAQVDGLISFYTDGFENTLNMHTYGDFSPAEVRSMYKGNIPDEETTYSRSKSVSIYRLVRPEPWVVLMLCNEMDWTPVSGRSYKLLIESFDNTIVDATVESFTRSGGELLVRLKIEDTSALSNVLYIRSCQVQLGESVNSLMVPSRAIYVQEGRKGVIMNTEGGEYWTGVEVISDDGNVAYVIPENSGVLYDGVRVRLF
ncbi:MAG: hypothetical protein IJD39_00250 [Clostridia bacterium]|nr:hypothetical protein [Clostridia bacterium]